MPSARFETDIKRPAQPIFDLIADLPNYSKWLEPSGIYSEVIPVGNEPTKEGTTYSDVGKSAKMLGEVVHFEPPTYLIFHQMTEIKLLGLLKGRLEMRIQYILKPQGIRTQVVRDVSYDTAGVFRLLGWLVMGNIRKESPRILQKMKTYLEI